MKQFVIASFAILGDAEKAIERLNKELGVSSDAVSLVYRDSEGTVHEKDVNDIVGSDTTDGAKQGAVIGGGIGAIAGLAVATGLLPIIGPIVAAGPIVSALGLGAGAVGTAVAGGVTGAAVGGLVGALTSWGVDENRARMYEGRVQAGEILVTVHTDNESATHTVLRQCNALSIDTVAAAT